MPQRLKIPSPNLEMTRRHFLRSGVSAATVQLLLSAGVLHTAKAASASTQALDAAFNAHTLKKALNALGANPTPAAQIILTAPDLAENGASVEITLHSDLPNTTDMYLLVAKNPNPLVASFNVPSGTVPDIRLRIRMSETSAIHAVVKAGGQFYSTVHNTQVTVGGCLG